MVHPRFVPLEKRTPRLMGRRILQLLPKSEGDVSLTYLHLPDRARLRSLIELAGNEVAKGNSVILCQVTIALIELTERRFKERFPNVGTKQIHSQSIDENLTVAKTLIAYLKDPEPIPHVLFITCETFLQLPFFPNRAGWAIIFDEIPTCCGSFDKSLKDTHKTITNYIEFTPLTDCRYALLTPRTQARLEDIGRNISEDVALENFTALAKKLASPNWDVYTITDQYQKLIQSDETTKFLTAFAMLKSSR